MCVLCLTYRTVHSPNASVYGILAQHVHDHRMGPLIRKRLQMYLAVFACCSIWGLVHRVYQVFSYRHEPLYVLNILEAAFGPLQGFLNAMVYGVTHKMIERYKGLCCGYSTEELDAHYSPAPENEDNGAAYTSYGAEDNKYVGGYGSTNYGDDNNYGSFEEDNGLTTDDEAYNYNDVSVVNYADAGR